MWGIFDFLGVYTLTPNSSGLIMHNHAAIDNEIFQTLKLSPKEKLRLVGWSTFANLPKRQFPLRWRRLKALASCSLILTADAQQQPEEKCDEVLSSLALSRDVHCVQNHSSKIQRIAVLSALDQQQAKYHRNKGDSHQHKKFSFVVKMIFINRIKSLQDRCVMKSVCRHFDMAAISSSRKFWQNFYFHSTQPFWGCTETTMRSGFFKISHITTQSLS